MRSCSLYTNQYLQKAIPSFSSFTALQTLPSSRLRCTHARQAVGNMIPCLALLLHPQSLAFTCIAHISHHQQFQHRLPLPQLIHTSGPHARILQRMHMQLGRSRVPTLIANTRCAGWVWRHNAPFSLVRHTYNIRYPPTPAFQIMKHVPGQTNVARSTSDIVLGAGKLGVGGEVR